MHDPEDAGPVDPEDWASTGPARDGGANDDRLERDRPPHWG